MRAAILLLVGLSPGVALGGVKKIAACEDPEQLARRILSCTDNVLAEKAALACGDALAEEWKQANARLSALMANKAAGSQSAQLQQTGADLAATEAELSALIMETEAAADRLARYPRIMFDNPYAGPGLEGSSNCYKNPFHAIAKVVNDLDEKADQGEDALAAAEKLGGVTVARLAGLGAGKEAPKAASSVTRVAAPVFKAVTPPKAPASDITGVHEDELKREVPKATGASLDAGNSARTVANSK